MGDLGIVRLGTVVALDSHDSVRPAYVKFARLTDACALAIIFPWSSARW